MVVRMRAVLRANYPEREHGYCRVAREEDKVEKLKLDLQSQPLLFPPGVPESH